MKKLQPITTQKIISLIKKSRNRGSFLEVYVFDDHAPLFPIVHNFEREIAQVIEQFDGILLRKHNHQNGVLCTFDAATNRWHREWWTKPERRWF